jgi:dCMP deaminase
MTIPVDPVVLGLTGAFGSGCTTLAVALERAREGLLFRNIKISDLIGQQGDADRAPQNGTLPFSAAPERGSLQDIGDDYRKRSGLEYWAKRAIEKIESEDAEAPRIVLDGLRNPGEVDWLRRRFNRFFLVAVDAHPETRWRRLEEFNKYWQTRGRAEFDAVSARDIEAPEDWGQRVQQCVDLADYLIDNDRDVERTAAPDHLLDKANDLLGLCQGTKTRRPDDEELFMNLAYSSAWGSACIKRNVGAVIVLPEKSEERELDMEHTIPRRARFISAGFNENPEWMSPCYLEFKGCFKDIWRLETWKKMQVRNCPYCGTDISNLQWPYRCPKASECPGPSGSLLEVFFPERAMTKCTAIHAEVRAILNAGGRDLSGCTMYVTTLPCFLCSEQILNVGIRRVVYVEAYPEARSQALLRNHGVMLRRFEGVKTTAFGRFFEPWRAEQERESTRRVYVQLGGQRD